MGLVLGSRVKQESTTTGTGTYSLIAPDSGFQGFVAGVGDTNTTYYVASDGVDWEVGIGTVTDATPDTLSRDTILSSSNSGAAVNWGAGTKTLECFVPADRVSTTLQFPMAIVYDNAGQSITDTDAALTAFAWDTESVDTHGFADLGSNDDRLTVPASMAGYWFEVGVLVALDASQYTGFQVQIEWYDSADSLQGIVGYQISGDDVSGEEPNASMTVLSMPVNVSSGDYFVAKYGADIGSTSVVAGIANNAFWIRRLAG